MRKAVLVALVGVLLVPVLRAPCFAVGSNFATCGGNTGACCSDTPTRLRIGPCCDDYPSVLTLGHILDLVAVLPPERPVPISPLAETMFRQPMDQPVLKGALELREALPRGPPSFA